MENNNNGSSKSMLQSNDPQSDGATDMSPTSGEGTSTRNIKMLPVSYSVLDSGCCGGPLKREIGTIVNNQQIKCCEDEKDDAPKLKDVVECEKINVRTFNGSKFFVQVALESTIESFKELIVGNSGIPVQNQRLFYKGKILQNDQSLKSYGLGANHTVHLVRCCAPIDADDGTNNSDAGTVTYDDADSEGHDELLQEGDFQPMQPPYGFVNPSSVRDFFNTPTMQYLIVNPDIIWDILTNNIELPPNVVLDPSIVSQILEAARNPATMREMMRLSDLALNNIESSPDGFNMLRYIYADTQAGNGITGIFGTYDGNARDGSINIETNASSSLPNTTPLPNPWAPNTTPLPNPWAFTEAVDDQTNIRRSTTDFSDLEGMLERIFMPNDALQIQLVQDPPTPQFIEFIPSNPEALCQFDGRNVEQDGMPDLSSLREEIQNSEFLRLSFQPEILQQPPSFWEEDLQPELSQQQPMQEPGQTSGDTASGACHCREIAEQLFATQLSQLQEMGFNDTEENIRALFLTSGNIDAAVQHLWWLLHRSR